MTHLRLVPPPKPSIPFELDGLFFAQIGNDIFICHNGVWDLATNHHTAIRVLLDWSARINEAATRVDDAPLRWPIKDAGFWGK